MGWARVGVGTLTCADRINAYTIGGERRMVTTKNKLDAQRRLERKGKTKARLLIAALAVLLLLSLAANVWQFRVRSAEAWANWAALAEYQRARDVRLAASANSAAEWQLGRDNGIALTCKAWRDYETQQSGFAGMSRAYSDTCGRIAP